MSKPIIRYEDGAEQATVTGWVCKTCRRWHGNTGRSEHSARHCCSNDRPCECGGRITGHTYSVCADCRREMDEARWAALPKVVWDGHSPLCEWQGDNYYWSEDDLIDHMEEHDLGPEDMRLVLATTLEPRHFSLYEFLSDDLPTDFDSELPGNWREVDKAVNDYIQGHKPYAWWPGNTGILPSSLPRPRPKTEAADDTL